MKGIVVSLIYFLDYVSFVYRMATDFSEEIFHPATVMKVFIRCRSSLVEIWGHLCMLLYHLQTDTLTSSFSICMPFIFFSYLISLVKTLSTSLDRYGEGEQFVLFLILGGLN